ncbi:MAG: hypothetical protein JST58_02525 [Bacteroidetes bacterium]|nr:hypothetical protein [Bacteroidota bacterium]
MKTGFYPLLNAIVSNIAIVFCFVPFILLLLKKLQYQKIYLLIGLYWLATALLNQYNWLGNADDWDVQTNLMFVRNLIGIHFVLAIYLLCANGDQKKIILYSLFAFATFELLIATLNGINQFSGVIIDGVGALLVLAFSLVGLAGYFKEIEHSPYEHGIAFIYAAFLFAYGSVAMIYSLNYFKVATVNDPNEFFLYYVGLLLAVLLTCYGFWQYASKTSQSKTETYE